MTKKLKLDLDALRLDTFTTSLTDDENRALNGGSVVTTTPTGPTRNGTECFTDHID